MRAEHSGRCLRSIRKLIDFPLFPKVQRAALARAALLVACPSKVDQLSISRFSSSNSREKHCRTAESAITTLHCCRSSVTWPSAPSKIPLRTLTRVPATRLGCGRNGYPLVSAACILSNSAQLTKSCSSSPSERTTPGVLITVTLLCCVYRVNTYPAKRGRSVITVLSDHFTRSRYRGKYASIARMFNEFATRFSAFERTCNTCQGSPCADNSVELLLIAGQYCFSQST